MGCPHGDEPQRCAVCLRAQLQQAIKRAEAAERALVLACANISQENWGRVSEEARADILDALPAEALAQKGAP